MRHGCIGYKVLYKRNLPQYTRILTNEVCARSNSDI